jgi:Type II secretion system (T2SS), protein K
MKRRSNSAGFALLLVLWTLIILSTIALTLAASVGTEVRASQDAWNDLQAERLARSGHDMATYLETRGGGTRGEDFSNLPAEVLTPGMKYRVSFDIGAVEILYEGENGKIDIANASEENIRAFFTAWTGDANRGREIADSLADWTDANDDPRPYGAESFWYLNRGYLPRNGPLGSADLFLVKGLTPNDFAPTLVDSDKGPSYRIPLTRVISTTATGSTVNPNYAAPGVLRILPGMTEDLLSRILQLREVMPFAGAQDFQTRTGVSADSPIVSRLAFARGTTPAIRTEPNAECEHS